MKILFKGSSDERVISLQRKLQEYGFYEGEIKDKFDELTETAVKDFQDSEGLAADGIVGLMTLQALDLIELGLVDI